MKFSKKNILLERGLFFINFCFVITMIVIFYFNLKLEYFFYTLIISTLIISYVTFTKYKTFSKGIVLTNLFVYFYFLYPYIAEFTTNLIGSQSAYILILYTLLLAFILLEFLGKKEHVLRTIYDLKFKGILGVFALALVFGTVFYVAGEPIPTQILEEAPQSLIIIILHIFFLSFLIGVSEQLLFTGFLYNTYSTMTRAIDAQIQTALLFVSFHMLRIKAVVSSFMIQYGPLAETYIFLYFCFLFVFMNISILLYRGCSWFKGSFAYSVIFHTIVDFTLISLIFFL